MSGRKPFVAARMLKSMERVVLTAVDEANSLLAFATSGGLAWQHLN
jgi:hypothetical protein